MKLKDILAKLKRGEALNAAEYEVLEQAGLDKNGEPAKKTVFDNAQKIVGQFATTVKDLGNGVIEAIVASEMLDRHGEVLEMGGLDTKEYMKNPVVAWAHKYDEPAIGQTLSLKKQDGKLIAKIQFAVDEYPFAQQIYKLYKGGYMRAFSIGFIPQEMEENRFTKAQMIEHSAVLVPANPEALALAKAKGINLEIVEEVNNGKHIIKQEEDTMNLKEILAKLAKGETLSAEELAFLKAHDSELTAGQRALVKEATGEAGDEGSDEGADDGSDAGAGEEGAADAVAELEKTVKSLANSVATIAKSVDTVVARKSINGGARRAKADSELGKEEKLKLWYKGFVSGDMAEYMDTVGKSAMNTTDESAILPPEEFIAEVSRLEEQYGVAARYATVRRTTRPTMRGIKGGTDDVEFVEVSEGGVKPTQKVSYLPYELTFKKFAAIVPVTDELLEDSAIDLWNDLTGRFARAAARKEDELVFTHATSGLLNVSGTVDVYTGGDSFLDLTADDLNEMIYAVPTASAANGRFYFHRTMLGVIQRLKDSEGRYIWMPGVQGGAEATVWGRPYTLTEVMPAVSDDAAATPFVAFGDLTNTTLGIRVPMQLKFFDTGIVQDPDDEEADLNLMTQDIQAIRARIRMNVVHRHANAYSLLTTGQSGS